MTQSQTSSDNMMIMNNYANMARKKHMLEHNNKRGFIMLQTTYKKFEATSALNLNLYDISSALQTTLVFNELISIFTNILENVIPYSAFSYINKEFDLEIKKGVFAKHSCDYSLTIEGQQLGQLKLTRNNKFSDTETGLLESLLSCLVYPLKNATLYNKALKLAHTDSLTKAQNRGTFDENILKEMSLARRSNKSLSVLFIDIDHFKSINDTYGHHCGDVALTSVVKWAKECLRDSDTIYRYGGEEFAVLLSNDDAHYAEALAERIRKSIERHVISYDMQIINITASIGVSVFKEHDTAGTFVKRADYAMYQAKRSGRNKVVVSY